MMKLKFSILLTLILTAGLFLAFMDAYQPKPWKVPEKYQNMENPVAGDKEALSTGKTLYNQHCKSCHGKEGYGDGSKAAQLDTPSGDFTEPQFTEQSDGTVFYKSKFGRDDMPSFEKKIPDDEDIWAVVSYIRTFE